VHPWDSAALVGAVVALLQALTLWVLTQLHNQVKRAPRRRTDPPGTVHGHTRRPGDVADG
jgi:hypothetical protein